MLGQCLNAKKEHKCRRFCKTSVDDDTHPKNIGHPHKGLLVLSIFYKAKDWVLNSRRVSTSMQIRLHCNLSGASETRASTRHAASIVILLLLSSSLHLELCDLLKGVNASARGSCFAKFSLNCIRLKANLSVC